MSTDDRIRVERDGALVSVVLDHPTKLNVLDGVGWDRFGALFEELGADPSIRCITITGAGGRAFSAGSDIGSFAQQRDTPEQVRAYGAFVDRALRALSDCPHPTVSIIEGLCVGGGLIMAAASDLRICGASSRFGAPINRLGLTMAYEELSPLLRAVGPGPVLELLLTGDLIDASRAREVGLVHRVVPDSEVAERGMALAERVAGGAPLVNRWHKKFVRRLQSALPLTDAERQEAYEAFQTRDYREGRGAFIERRSPRFTGE